jgi:hypothetical protein
VEKQDSQNRTAKTGQPKQDSQNRTAKTGQPKQDSQKRTGQPAEDSKRRIDRTYQAGRGHPEMGQSAKDYMDSTARI